MTAILPKHFYGSFYADGDPYHIMYDGYNYDRYTTGMTTTELNNSAGILRNATYTPATLYNGCHRFSLKQASDWYYKLEGWRMGNVNYYFDHRDFETRAQYPQMGMWVHAGLETFSSYNISSFNSEKADGASAAFWGKHLGFGYNEIESNGVYDFFPYFRSYSQYVTGTNPPVPYYPKQQNYLGGNVIEVGDQIIAQAWFTNNTLGTATSKMKDWVVDPDGGGELVERTTSKVIRRNQPDVMWSFTPSNVYGSLRADFAYITGEDYEGTTIDNDSITKDSQYFTSQYALDQFISSYLDARRYLIPEEYFNNPNLYYYEDPAQLPGLIQASKDAYVEWFTESDPTERYLGLKEINPVTLSSTITTHNYFGVPVYEHRNAGHTGILEPIFTGVV